MKMVTIEMIERACRYGKKMERDIYFHRSAKGPGVNVQELDPAKPETRKKLEEVLGTVKRHYTFSGLGLPSEKNSVSWRKINLPPGRRLSLWYKMAASLFMRGNPKKVKFLRKMGYHIGDDAEIMQFCWLDHFRPELIYVGEKTLLGAFSKISVHAYEGGGRFTYGITEIGSSCIIGGGSTLGGIKIEDNVRLLPDTTVSPYMARIKKGSVVGWNPPPVRSSSEERQDKGDNAAN